MHRWLCYQKLARAHGAEIPWGTHPPSLPHHHDHHDHHHRACFHRTARAPFTGSWSLRPSLQHYHHLLGCVCFSLPPHTLFWMRARAVIAPAPASPSFSHPLTSKPRLRALNWPRYIRAPCPLVGPMSVLARHQQVCPPLLLPDCSFSGPVAASVAAHALPAARPTPPQRTPVRRLDNHQSDHREEHFACAEGSRVTFEVAVSRCKVTCRTPVCCGG
jgi:hypothetical protein